MNEAATTSSERPLSRLLLEAAHQVEAGLEQALGQVGMSLAKYGVLSHLARSVEPMPLSQLAARSACVRSNMTQLVDRLEAEGLVERVPDPADRRSVRAALTAEGRRRFAEGQRLFEEAERTALASLSADEREALARVAGRLTQPR
jgi:DNA-binding MarR family transcriptional regulator